MKLKCISCEALARIVYACAAESPHIVDVALYQIGLHDKPADLRQRLQAEIDAASGKGYDALVLAYGLCGKATDGVTARDVPLVMPRAHDCITLFLGSRQRYNEQFNGNPGTYWYALDFIERRSTYDGALSLGSLGFADVRNVYDEYVQKYGKDNADYLMEVMGAWQAHYNRAVFIDMGIGDGKEVEKQASLDAARRGWTYERMAGDATLIHRLLFGEWENDFLQVPPGYQVRMTGTGEIITALEAVEDQAE